MDSEYGFIGEVKREADGVPYLHTHAITNIAWNTETSKFYDDNVDAGLKFYNLNSLFGSVITTSKPVISNDCPTDPRGCGIPEGHPPLTKFLGIPFFEQGGENMNGMVGIANKRAGYSQADIDFLEPFTVTCSNLIQAYTAMRENKVLINQLEEKVTARTWELENANKQIMQASKKQLEFFACMSHEIRTPLNGILGLSSLLQDNIVSPSEANSLNMIVKSGELLLGVVNDVLDYAKLETGNLNVEIHQISLQETLDAVLHPIAIQALKKQIKLCTYYDVNVPEKFLSDSRRIQQIMYNLLGNAIKFSYDGGIVELTVSVCTNDDTGSLRNLANNNSQEAHENENGQAEKEDVSRCPFHRPEKVAVSNAESVETRQLKFMVKDYGKGIARSDLAQIFQPFQQASGTTRQTYEGTGLGLSITSKLVKGLGGTITVDSQLGEFSEFTLKVPLLDDTPVDLDKIAKQMKDSHILFVSNDGDENFDVDIIQRFGVKFLKFESCEALDVFIGITGNIDKSQTYLCLIQEDLYRSDTYQRLSKIASSHLLSFGPKYSITEGSGHFCSLSRMLPSVLMKRLVSLSKSSGGSIPKTRTKFERTEDKIDYAQIQTLIVEDNAINQKVLKRMLLRLGVKHIDIADNGKIALKRSCENNYDIIFMDMQMPVMGGIEATRLIRDRQSGSHSPTIVFVTANVGEMFEDTAKSAGADTFISKPFKISEIELTLETLVTKLAYS
eukprot:scaffold18060_cov55-Attheya_sp.AAC.4